MDCRKILILSSQRVSDKTFIFITEFIYLPIHIKYIQYLFYMNSTLLKMN